jgi:hypothetical protein
VNKINNVPKMALRMSKAPKIEGYKVKSLEKGGRFTAAPLAPPGLALEDQAKRGS